MALLKTIRRAGRKSTVGMRRYFGYGIIYPWERPSIMRKHIYTGAMGNVYLFLISGMFFVYFGNRVGMTPFHWGVMSGISSFLLTAQIFSAMLTQRKGRRKVLWFGTAVMDRVLRLAGIAAAFLMWRAGWGFAPIMLILGICASNLFMALSVPPWMSWLAEIVPEEEHGTFWGKRTSWMQASALGVMVVAGLLMDRTPDELKPRAALAIFAVAGAVGIADLIIHGTIPEPRMDLPDRQGFLHALLIPLRDRAFRPWLTFNAVWSYAMTLGGALSTIYFVEDLDLKRNFMVGTIVLVGASQLGGFAAARLSGGLVDRYGPKRVLQISHVFWALLPAFWIFASPGTAAFWLAGGSLTGGASSTAGTIAQNKLITRFAAPEECPMYVAVSSCIGSLACGLGTFTAGTFLQALGGWTWNWGWISLGAFPLLFAISVVLRLAATLALIPRIRVKTEGKE